MYFRSNYYRLKYELGRNHQNTYLSKLPVFKHNLIHGQNANTFLVPFICLAELPLENWIIEKKLTDSGLRNKICMNTLYNQGAHPQNHRNHRNLFPVHIQWQASNDCPKNTLRGSCEDYKVDFSVFVTQLACDCLRLKRKLNVFFLWGRWGGEGIRMHARETPFDFGSTLR